MAQTGGTGDKKSTKGTAQAPAKKATTASGEKTVPRPKSFDLGAMDKSVDPCEDFYEYACGSWRKKNPIPSDQARWGRFNELAEYNRQYLHNILEKESANDPKRTPVMQKIGDMYQSCMDEATVDAKGSTPLKPRLDRIAAITNKDQLVETIAYLQSLGVPVLFGFNASPDLHNASMEIASVGQGGLGLPDRDYYIDTDPKSQETREKYLDHVTKMFVLLGDDEDAAKKEAQAVMDIEHQLAEAAFKRVMMRDPKNRDHKMKVADLEALAPNFKFDRFFASSGAPSFSEVNVVPPDFFQKVNATVESV
ncbi:MAG: M13 family metallopeptidase N-terminal domain-containing protein, partial [Candidatus Angelobacter sp.]